MTTTATWSRASRCTWAVTSGVEAAFGRKFRGHKVTKAETADYCERVLRGYLERRDRGERSPRYVARAEEDWLL